MNNAQTPNQIIETLFQTRFTCKGYDPERQVSDADFATIIEAGRLSPSSMGFEPWHFVELRSQTLVSRLKEHCWGAPGGFAGVGRVLALLTRTGADMRPGSDYLRHMHEDIQHWPVTLEQRMAKVSSFQQQDRGLDSDQKIHEWATHQTYIALANMLTAAAFLGVDSTPIEGFHLARVHQLLVDAGVYDPQHFQISCFLTLGYSNREHRPKTRRPLNEVFSVYQGE